MSSVDAIFDLLGSKINNIPDQSLDNSVDLHTGHILPVVNALHFLHADSLANKVTILMQFLFLVFFCVGGNYIR
jgi:hypothetical protein